MQREEFAASASAEMFEIQTPRRRKREGIDVGTGVSENGGAEKPRDGPRAPPTAPAPTPQRFICPLTSKVMKDPARLSDGHAYEYQAAVAYVACKTENGQQATSFVTGEPLTGTEVTACRKSAQPSVGSSDTSEIYRDCGPPAFLQRPRACQTPPPDRTEGPDFARGYCRS